MMAALILGQPLPAQNYLCVEHKGQPAVVRKIHNGCPYVMDNGELVPVISNRVALAAAPEFRPVLVKVSDLRVRARHLEVVGGSSSGAELNHDFLFKANFESSYALSNVFLVLELETEQQGRLLFFYEIGAIGPGRSRRLDLSAPTHSALGEGRYQIHLFADGPEVFHSQQPVAYREDMLDRMVLKRVTGLAQASPEYFAGPAPEFPAALRKKALAGKATIRARITARGAVADPVIESASDPAFGEVALDAVRSWRFLPAVENGRPVERTASIPIEFARPESGAKGRD